MNFYLPIAEISINIYILISLGVGIGFKEVHLRNLTYFSHLDTVEEGAPDLDVGVNSYLKGKSSGSNCDDPFPTL